MLIINKKGKKNIRSVLCLPGSEFESWTNLFSFLFSCFLPLLFLLGFSYFFLPWLLFALCSTAGPYLSFRRFFDTRISSYYCFVSFVVVSICFILLFFFRMTKMSLPSPGPEIVGKADRKKYAKNAR